MTSRLGWKKDKFDQRDYLHRPKLVKIPRQVDNSGLLPPVRDQGAVGSCVGFGIGTNVCSVAKRLGIFTEWYSPTWIYNGARFIEGTLDSDAGCEPGDALQWLFDHGCLLEHFWPYDPTKLDMSAPSSQRESEAIKYIDFQFFRVDQGQDGIMSALAEQHLVSIGNPWFAKWMDSPAQGILPSVQASDKVDGGHETCIYKGDQDTGFFWIQNSWGTGWGDGGRFAIPFEAFDVFKQLGGYDAHYITFPASPAPTPPGPTPAPGCLPGSAIIAKLLRKRKGAV